MTPPNVDPAAPLPATPKNEVERIERIKRAYRDGCEITDEGMEFLFAQLSASRAEATRLAAEVERIDAENSRLSGIIVSQQADNDDACSALRAEAARLRDALQMLRDHQNGPPLPSYEAGWTKAMAMADEALAPAPAAKGEETPRG